MCIKERGKKHGFYLNLDFAFTNVKASHVNF